MKRCEGDWRPAIFARLEWECQAQTDQIQHQIVPLSRHDQRTLGWSKTVL